MSRIGKSKKRRFSRRNSKKKKRAPKSVLRKRRRSKIGSTKQKRKRYRKKKIRFSRHASGPNWSHEEPPMMTNAQLRDYKKNDFYEFYYDC